jgi:hypothetical protein
MVKLAHALGTNIARGTGGNGASGANGHTHPFEFRVLECLLAATVSFFEGAQRCRRHAPALAIGTRQATRCTYAANMHWVKGVCNHVLLPHTRILHAS